jgi:hypothetical protein
MAAGQGFKTFTTGEVLTAGDVNGYLMQGINVFTNATARDAAITAPAEGQFAFTKDNNSLWYYDGAAWVASGATGDIEGVTATSPLTGGGTSGTVTVGIQNASTSQRGSVQLSDSTSTTDSTLAATSTAVKSAYDLANGAIPKSLIDAAGDLIVGTAADTAGRIAIGSTGQVLTVSGGTAAWATPASAASFVGASVYKSTTQSIPTATETILTFPNENFDTDAYHDNSTNNGRFTIPSGKNGKYLLVANVNWDGSSSGNRQAYFVKNGTTTMVMLESVNAGTRGVGYCLSTIVALVAGDYIDVRVWQNNNRHLEYQRLRFLT